MYSYQFLIQWKSINKNMYFPMIRQTLSPYKKTFYTVNTIYWEYKNLKTAAHVKNFPMKTTKFLVASQEIVSKI